MLPNLDMKYIRTQFPFFKAFLSENNLQTLSAVVWISLLVCGGSLGITFTVYSVVFTRFWWLTLLYLYWAWIIDIKTCEQGGRRLEWVRNWIMWKYLKDYFPFNLKHVNDVELDPKCNYLFCCFPHGIASAGAFLSFATSAGGFQRLFPEHTPYLLTISYLYYLPFFREFLYALGTCAVSAKSIDWLLGTPKGGNVAVVVVGGIAEMYYSCPDHYQLVLKKRKGFIKRAIINGTPLVPVFSFGEVDIYDQTCSLERSFVRRMQQKMHGIVGFAPIVVRGRGLLHYKYGLIPYRKPITTVVGQPIPVAKNPNPTEEEINRVHKTFIEKLTDLFEEEKYKYLKNPEDSQLNIV